MKKLYKWLFILNLIFSAQGALSQNFGQTWINFNQPYFKIRVSADGIYKISYDILNQTGNNAFLNKSQLQIWHRGIQQNILIQSSGEILTSGDYILFYGIKNNGESDTLLYNPPTEFYNPYSNLFSDTSAYFLTVSETGPWKRMITISNSDISSPTDIAKFEIVNNYFDDYWEGGWENEDPLSSIFHPGEGWVSNVYTDEHTVTFDIPNYSAGEANLELYLLSCESKIFSPKIYLSGSNGNLQFISSQTDSTNDEKYPKIKLKTDLPLDLAPYIVNNKLTFKVLHHGLGIFGLGYSKLVYNGKTDLSGKRKSAFTINGSTNISGNLPNSIFALVTDRNNVHILKESLINNSFILPHFTSSQRVFFTEKPDSISSLTPVIFKDYLTSDSLFLIITHQKLFSAARDYASFRNSAEGGSYDTLIAEINQITDQFNYGEKSPLAIRKFLNFLKSKNLNAPDHLFIIGHGLKIDNFKQKRNNPELNIAFEDLVFPSGVPGGDFLFSMGLNGRDETNGYQNMPFLYPSIATGRLSARTNDQVLGYLNKVKEHEATTNEPWKRNVLHLSGGYQDNKSVQYNKEQAELIKNQLEECAAIIRQPYLGANVTSFGRFISGSGRLIDVSAEVNKGVSLITFLGHSNSAKTDVSIGLVSEGHNFFNYSNKGKYPMLYLNGCVVGNTFYDAPSHEPNIIQDWILTKNRGAILALSNTGTGYLRNLKENIENTYTTLFTDSLNFSKTIGEQILLSHKNLLLANPIINIHLSSLLQTSTLQGDPAIQLFKTAKPDYSSNCEKISIKSFLTTKITTQTDSFNLLIPVNNKGLYSNIPLNVSVKRFFANNSRSIQYPLQVFPAVTHSDTLRFKIKGAIPESAGANTFEITLDPENKILEKNKSDNICSATIYIPGVSMIGIHPPNFSIVNKESTNLVAQSTTLTTTEREFIFEIDTAYSFNSPLKKSYVSKSFNLPEWKNITLPVSGRDSIVYYWKVRYSKPMQNEDTAATISSFTYIKNGDDGWSQSKPAQFYDNESKAILLDKPTGRWNFNSLTSSLKMYTFGPKSKNNTPTENFMSFDNVPQIFNGVCWRWGYDGVYILAINPIDFTVRPSYSGNNDNICNPFSSPFVSRFIDFKKDDENKRFRMLDSTLRDIIHEGEIIALMTIGDAKFSYWPEYLKNTVKSKFGATRIDSLADEHPYILVSRKGVGKIAELFPTDTNRNAAIISLDTSLTSLGNAGIIHSPLIGPAIAWKSFHAQFTKSDKDSVLFNIIGIDSAGNEITLVNALKENSFDLSNIDAVKYPFLKLIAVKKTISSQTPQLLNWQVSFKKSPEGALVFGENSAGDYKEFLKQEGDSSKKLDFLFKNISSEPFSPGLKVRYNISGENQTLIRHDTLKTALLPDSTWKYSFHVNTKGLSGKNTLEVFFNPSPGQQEEFLGNNLYSLSFDIIRDNTNPVLDVSFDGVKIMNGDIISPSPTITVKITDENKFLKIRDTSGLSLELARPCGQLNCGFEKIYLGSNEIVYYPAVSGKTFELKYQPKKLPDGLYTLKVQAKDASGNLSGNKPYMIRFEVVNEVAVSNFLPYPNPFSTKMWFIYTLTGEIPDQIRIQFFTITGKLVKSIFMEELGPLKIGTHKTEFVWDGTDDYGDQLANGLYIYNVAVRKNGEQFKHRSNKSDESFKNGYGKIYILR